MSWMWFFVFSSITLTSSIVQRQSIMIICTNKLISTTSRNDSAEFRSNINYSILVVHLITLLYNMVGNLRIRWELGNICIKQYSSKITTLMMMMIIVLIIYIILIEPHYDMWIRPLTRVMDRKLRDLTRRIEETLATLSNRDDLTIDQFASRGIILLIDWFIDWFIDWLIITQNHIIYTCLLIIDN